jgi:hypothetical protein
MIPVWRRREGRTRRIICFAIVVLVWKYGASAFSYIHISVFLSLACKIIRSKFLSRADLD